jgi:hypothetical protein
MKPTKRTPFWLAGLAVLAALAPAARADEPKPPLDQALRDNAPKVLKKLADKKYKNIGVLKFLVDNGTGKPRDDVGPLNTSLADRLEVALVLSLPDESLGVVGNATKGVAASPTPGANHRTEEGRKEILGINKKYFLVPWRTGKEDTGVKPDAFLTGVAVLSKDRRSLHVVVQVFDRADQGKELRTVDEFDAANDLRTLTESGITYSTRGIKDGTVLPSGSPELLAKATPPEDIPQPDDKPATLLEKAERALVDFEGSPVKLEILYDDKPQHVQAAPLGLDQGNVLLRVATPGAAPKKQAVTFRLTNPSKTDTYGVVLKVNGQNTIHREQSAAYDCKKWILEPGDNIVIRGFQLDEDNDKAFEVLAPEVAAGRGVYYGDNAGTFSLDVFRSGKEPEAVARLDVAAVSRGMSKLTGQPKATTLKGFQDQLQEETGRDQKEARSRGLVTDQGRVGSHPVKQVTFIPTPYPVVSATIRYYDPQK